MTEPSWQDQVPESYRALARELATALAPEIILEGVLGVGGMGAVMVGREAALDRKVAVKLLSPSLAGDAVAHARFMREAQAAAAVQHANVVPIFRVGELPSSGTPYFVMQHVTGRTLDAAFPEGTPAPVRDVQRIMGQVASALAAAHAKGLVHRDIKPANVLFDDDGRRVMVVDFGISATRAERPADQKLTQQGQTLGTPQYMSPEVAAGEPAGPASDVYSLGCLAYELLSGHPVFTASTPQGVIARHIRDVPAPIAESRKDVPAELAALVERCLAKLPDVRPSAESIANALLPEELPFEWPPPGMRRVHGWLARSAPWFAVATLLFGTPLLLSLGLGMDTALVESPRALWVGVLLLLPIVVFMMATTLATAPFFDALRVGRNGGLSSFTVLEVLADPGDTARLIAGLREYATLTQQRCRRLRRLRVIRPVLLVSTAPLTILAFPVGWLILPRLGGDSTGFSWLGAAAFALPVMISALLGLFGGTPFWRPARRRTQLVERLPAETRRWRASIARATGDDPLLSADPVPLTVRLVTEYGLGVSIVAATSLLVYLSITLILGGLSQVGRVGYRIDRLEEQRQWRAVPAALRAPVDSAVSEAEAGRIAYRLFLGRSPSVRQYLPPADTFPSYAMFREDSLRQMFALGNAPGDVWERIIARVATTGVTAAQRAYLERGSAHPAAALLSRLAHAPHMDLYASVLGSPAHVGWALWVWNPATEARGASQPHFARAALLAADGKLDEAAAVVREVVSVGALLMEDGRRQVDFRVGTERVRRGTSVLRLLLARTGSGAEATVLGDGPTASELVIATRRGAATPSADSAAALLRGVAKGGDFLAHRFAALNGLRLAHCRAPVSALFAESPSDAGAFLAVERSLRRASDRALLAWVRDTLGRPTLPAPAAAGDRVLPKGVMEPGSTMRTVGRMLGMLGWSASGGACALVSDNGTFW